MLLAPGSKTVVSGQGSPQKEAMKKHPVVPEPRSEPGELPDPEIPNGRGADPAVFGASGLDDSLNSGIAAQKDQMSDIGMIRQLLSRKVTWVVVTVLLDSC